MVYRIITLAAMTLLFSCSKDNDNNVTPVKNVDAKYSLTFPTADYTIDSMQTTVMQADGTMANATITGNTWTTAVRTYKTGDSVYASVKAYGRKLNLIANTPTLFLTNNTDNTVVSSGSSSATTSGSTYVYTGIVAGRVK